MTAEQVVGCAPFRLQQPRPLTPYEWTVAGGAVLSGFARAGMFTDAAGAAALMGALSAQHACPSWKMSAFGPAPAVASLPYECLGEWFARLPYQDRLRALHDIAYTQLLCAPNPPWNVCGSDAQRAAQAWEGAPQIGAYVPGMPVESCAEPRMRTAYIPTSVDEIVKMFKTLGGQLPPAIEQGYAMLPPAARQRTLLLGVQLKPATADLPAILAGATNPIVLAQGLVEEVAIIWAPGRGSSLTGMLHGNVDPRALIELATAMMPDILGGLQIPAMPGLDLGSILGTLGGLFKQAKIVGGMHGTELVFDGVGRMRGFESFGAGPTPTTGATGVPVVDTPGDELDKTPPLPGIAVIDTTFSPFAAFAIAGAVGTAIYLVYKHTKRAA